MGLLCAAHLLELLVPELLSDGLLLRRELDTIGLVGAGLLGDDEAVEADLNLREADKDSGFIRG